MAREDLMTCPACGPSEEHQIGAPYCLGRLAAKGPALADEIATLRSALAYAEARRKVLADAILLFVADMDGVELRFDMHVQLRALRDLALATPRAAGVPMTPEEDARRNWDANTAAGWDSTRQCGEVGTWICSRPPGHDGDHVAVDERSVRDRWPRTPLPPRAAGEEGR